MQTPIAEIAKARSFPFVKDVFLAANTHMYVVELRYEYPSILKPGKNYLTIDADTFTADAVLESFRLIVVEYFRWEYEKAQALYKLAKGREFGDIMNEM